MSAIIITLFLIFKPYFFGCTILVLSLLDISLFKINGKIINIQLLFLSNILRYRLFLEI